MRKVAESTVRRLSLYLRFLEEFEGQGIETVSSGALASRGGTTSAQVRKDLSFFGSFGKRGLGYPVPELADRLREILGLKQRYQVAHDRGGEDRQRAGAVPRIPPARVRHRRHLRQRSRRRSAASGTASRSWTSRRSRPSSRGVRMDMAVLVTPARRGAGRSRTAWWRWASRRSSTSRRCSSVLPDDVVVKTVNLALELETLSYALANR